MLRHTRMLNPQQRSSARSLQLPAGHRKGRGPQVGPAGGWEAAPSRDKDLWLCQPARWTRR